MKLYFYNADTCEVVKSFKGDYTFETAVEVADFFDEYFEVGYAGDYCFILENDKGEKWASIVANDGSTIWWPANDDNYKI
jgi:hypothetical protein